MAEDASSVSRSGRVRKKSSKLTDYQSPDELDSTRPPGKRRSLTSVSSAATAQVQELPPDQLLATEEDPGTGLFTPGVGIGLQLEDIDVREEELDEAPTLRLMIVTRTVMPGSASPLRGPRSSRSLLTCPRLSLAPGPALG